MRTWKIHDSRVYRQISRLGSEPLQTTSGEGHKGEEDVLRFSCFLLRRLLGLIIIGEVWGWGGWGGGGGDTATSVQSSLRPGLDRRTRTETGLNTLLGEEEERAESELFMKGIH